MNEPDSPPKGPPVPAVDDQKGEKSAPANFSFESPFDLFRVPVPTRKRPKSKHPEASVDSEKKTVTRKRRAKSEDAESDDEPQTRSQAWSPLRLPSTRRPSEIRQACRASFEQRLGLLDAILDDPKSRPDERMKALLLLAQYGLGDKHELVLEKGEWLNAVAAVTADYLQELGHTTAEFEVWFERLRSTLEALT